jgi:hypothetical protein
MTTFFKTLPLEMFSQKIFGFYHFSHQDCSVKEETVFSIFSADIGNKKSSIALPLITVIIIILSIVYL